MWQRKAQETNRSRCLCDDGEASATQDAVSGGGYASQNDSRLHFGLGAGTLVDKLEVKWPDGSVESFAVSVVDRFLTLVEGEGVAGKMPNNSR